MLSQETDRPATPPVGSAPTGWWLSDRLALLISVLSGLFVFGFTFRGGWFIDDFVDFGIAKESRLNRAYVLRPIYGHPQPGTRILDWLLFRVAPMNYPLVAALSGLGIGFMVWMLYRVLRLTFRPSPWLLVILSLGAFSVVWLPGTEWWAAACETVPCVITSTLMVHALLRCYLGPRRWLWAVLAGGWLGVGLSFFEVTLVGLAFAACFLLSVAARRFSLAEMVRVVRQAWPAYTVLAVVTLVYLAYYKTHQFVASDHGYSTTELVHFFGVSWSSALVPCLFGGPLGTGPLFAESRAYPPLWWLVLAQLLFVALIGYGIRNLGWRVLLGWAYFMPLYLFASYIIASARLHEYGPAIGREFRYVAGLMPLLILTMALTVLRPSFDRDEPESAAAPVRSEASVDRRRSTGAPVVAVAAVLTIFLVSAVPISRRWTDANNVRYARNLRASVHQLDAVGRPYSVYTTFASADTSSAIDGRYSLVPQLARLLTGRPVSADDLSKPMYVADDSGHLRPAKLAPYALWSGGCTRSFGDAPGYGITHPLQKWSWTVRLRYRVPAGTTLRIRAGGRFVVQETTDEHTGFLVSGSGELTFQLRPQPLSVFGFEADHVGACISDVVIGKPVPVS